MKKTSLPAELTGPDVDQAKRDVLKWLAERKKNRKIKKKLTKTNKLKS
jgi:hypothetical protein